MINFEIFPIYALISGHYQPVVFIYSYITFSGAPKNTHLTLQSGLTGQL